jgi:hypothetical protein
MLSVVVLCSFVYLALMSALLFLFIFIRRLIVERRERCDRAVYEAMERDLLAVLTAPDPRAAALDFARRHRGRARVLKSLLVAYRESLVGRALEPLKAVFEITIGPRCLRELRSPWLTTRLQNVRLFVDFSKPEEAVRLVELLNDKPVVRLAALNAIAGIASHDMLTVIFELFEKDPKPNFYAYSNVLNSLGQRIEPFVRSCLVKPLPPDKTGLLIEISGRLLFRGLYGPIVGFARHPDKELRLRTARALGHLLVPASRRPLMTLAADPAWEVQAQALRSLGYLQDPRAIPVLVKALFSLNWHVRNNAGHALAAFGPVGLQQLREIASQRSDRYAADMAAMVLDDVILAGAPS